MSAEQQAPPLTCGNQVDTPDGKVYTCTRRPKHRANHKDADGVEWSSDCGARWRDRPDARVKCQLKAGHKGYHRCNRSEWL